MGCAYFGGFWCTFPNCFPEKCPNLHSTSSVCFEHLLTYLSALNIIFKIFASLWDFPGGPVVKNPPYNAGDTGSIPGQGTKILHASGATTAELLRLS